MGTVQYLSPEQASGHPASPATDTTRWASSRTSAWPASARSRASRRSRSRWRRSTSRRRRCRRRSPYPVQNLVMAMIAKKPEERPASAAAVARAATALRRGDVAAAAAAVPAIATGVAGRRRHDAAAASAGGTPPRRAAAAPRCRRRRGREEEAQPVDLAAHRADRPAAARARRHVWALLGEPGRPAPDRPVLDGAVSDADGRLRHRRRLRRRSPWTPGPDRHGLRPRLATTARAAGSRPSTAWAATPRRSADQVNTVYRVEPDGQHPASQLLTLTFYVDQVGDARTAAPDVGGAGRPPAEADPGQLERLHLPVRHRIGERLQLHGRPARSRCRAVRRRSDPTYATRRFRRTTTRAPRSSPPTPSPARAARPASAIPARPARRTRRSAPPRPRRRRPRRP